MTQPKPRKPKPRKPKSLYPTRLQVGDRIEGDGWSAEWDGECVVGDCGYRYDTQSLRNRLFYLAAWIQYGHTSRIIDQTCIIEQLVAEGAL